MPLAAPYRVTFYGTDVNVVSDTDSEVLQSTIDALILAGNAVSQTIDCFKIQPNYNAAYEKRTGGGGIQVNSGSQYKSYSIVTTRLYNKPDDYSDITTIFEDLFTVFGKKYIFLKVDIYTRSLHTVDYLIKVILTRTEAIYAPARIYLEIECEKEKLNG